MPYPTVFRLALAMPLIALAGCVYGKPTPPDYSPGYSYVATADGSGKSADGGMLVPDACLAEPADGNLSPAATKMTIVSDLGEHLPPGCANAYNLQRMVESERDLVEGRRMGAAPGAPTARAARRYIYGEEASIGGADSAAAEAQAVRPSN